MQLTAEIVEGDVEIHEVNAISKILDCLHSKLRGRHL